MTNRDIIKSPLTLDNTIPNPPAYNIFNQLRSMATHSLAGLKYIHFPVLYHLLDARVCSAVDPGTTPTVSENLAERERKVVMIISEQYPLTP